MNYSQPRLSLGYGHLSNKPLSPRKCSRSEKMPQYYGSSFITNTITYPQQRIGFCKGQICGKGDRSSANSNRNVPSTWLRPKSDSCLRSLNSHMQWYNKNVQKQFTFAEGGTGITSKINLVKPNIIPLHKRRQEEGASAENIVTSRSLLLSAHTDKRSHFKLPKD